MRPYELPRTIHRPPLEVVGELLENCNNLDIFSDNLTTGCIESAANSGIYLGLMYADALVLTVPIMYQ